MSNALISFRRRNRIDSPVALRVSRDGNKKHQIGGQTGRVLEEKIEKGASQGEVKNIVQCKLP